MTEIKQLNWQRDDFENIEEAWEGDLWDRRRLGEQLTNYVDRLNCGAVLALDAPWGEGKTWFVRHWKKHLENENHNVIYLDAFANDYLDDPFLVITSEVINTLNKDQKTKRKVKKLIELSALVSTALLPSLPKLALTLGLHLVGAGFLSGALQQGYENAKDDIDALSEEASDRIKESIQEKIAGYEAEKKTLIEFKKHLAETVERLNKPLVFIIDELDRCRPDFAIRLIERIKHFFDIKNIVFVLVMNKAQFSKVVYHNYGYDENLSEAYLEKFVDFTVGLNSLSPMLQDNLKTNIYGIFNKLGVDLADIKLEGCLELINFYIKENNLSKRNIIKLASQFALLYSENFDKFKNQILIMLLVNTSFLLNKNNSLELYKVLLSQLDDYIDKNKSDFEKFKANYVQSNHSFLMIKAFFFNFEHDISVFPELVDNFEQLDSSYKRMSVISVKNLRPTENPDF